MNPNQLVETSVVCPYCWEQIEVLINPEEVYQEYIEDCQVCCQPIVFHVSEDMEGELSLEVRHENEP